MTLLDILPSIGHAAPVRFDPAVWPITTRSDEEGRMRIGDVPLTEIADEFHTPAYVIDEADFRHRARRYRKTLRDVEVVYAGKSLLTTAVARWAREEGLGIDVCSPGELAVALAGGVEPSRIIMHGNVKSPAELRDAVAVGVGRIVLDSCIEIAYLAGLARRRQKVLIRVTPDIDIHGHRAVTTGISDQKFGFTLDAGGAGGAADAVTRVLAHPILDLIGLHCHLGSQVADPALYGEAIHRMIAAMADIRAKHGVILTELNIGGGHAVPYIPGDPELDLNRLAAVIEDALDEACAAEHFPRPAVVVEPGRGISARSGVTLYRVCAVKSRPGGRTFVGVDGGMSDNPRVALYGAQYTVALANRHPLGIKQRVTVAGRHCEAGDELARDIELPADIHPGDLLAVACTGSYHHSMASNYNLVGRPPLVAVNKGRARELVRRETITDLLSRDCG